jgi:hypothetical protein
MMRIMTARVKLQFNPDNKLWWGFGAVEHIQKVRFCQKLASREILSGTACILVVTEEAHAL